MGNRLLFILITISLLGCKTVSSNQESSQEQVSDNKVEAKIDPGFNLALAQKLGADDYGMKPYVLVILKTGPEDAKITDKAKRAELFKGHFANMGRLAKEGKLVLAGPLSGDKPKRGLFILNVATIAEAEELVKTDPTVKAGIFTYDLAQYYGSAALQQVNEIHATLQKKAM